MQEIKERVALTSIVASGALTLAKAAVGVLSGSLALISEAAHSALDFAATVMTWYAVRVSGKPADEEHHYGHGKVESVTALIATGLLFVLSAAVIWEAAKRLFGAETHVVTASIWAFIVIVGSIVVDFLRARLLYKTARETTSHALEADALHFDSDMWSSIAVLAGLIGVALGYPWADSAAALVVAVVILIAGWRLGRRTVDTLTDTAPEGAAARITTAAEGVRGVVSVERVRVRGVGPTLFADLVVAVSRTLPLDRVAAIKAAVARAINDAMPEAEVDVVTEPRALSDESVLERVMVIARNQALAVHHVTVHAIGGRLSISLDLEVDGSLPLGKAHETADALEAAVRDELGPEVEVETHIEPLQVSGLAGRDAATARFVEVRDALVEAARGIAFVDQVHDVRVRETTDGEIVNFHCRVDPALTVQNVHEKVDEVERALRHRYPNIKRVIGHAEPRAS
jgi:cation diffusion facilitator family transporter